MSSRLFQEIRERQALVYSVHSGTQAYRDTGLLYVYAGTDAGELQQGRCSALMKEMRVAQEGRGHRRRAAAGPRTTSRAT